VHDCCHASWCECTRSEPPPHSPATGTKGMFTPGRSMFAQQSNTSPGRIQAHGCIRAKDYIVRRRRCFSGGIVRCGLGRAPVLRLAGLALTAPLPSAVTNPPSPCSLLSPIFGLSGRRIEPGNPGQGGRPAPLHTPDRRYAAARARPRHEDQALESGYCSPIQRRTRRASMLLDLGRNDVGRVAEIGSVKVTDQFFVERYSQVMAYRLQCRGQAPPDRDRLDALRRRLPRRKRSAARRRCARCRSSTNWKSRSARSTPAASDIFSAGEEMGYLHRAAVPALIKDGGHVCAGRRRHRRRFFRPGVRAAGVHQPKPKRFSRPPRKPGGFASAARAGPIRGAP